MPALVAMTWHDLLRAFIQVKELHLCAALSKELSRALQVDDVGSDPRFKSCRAHYDFKPKMMLQNQLEPKNLSVS